MKNPPEIPEETDKEGKLAEQSVKVLAEIGKLWRPNEAQPK
jgi:hypothetical protein